MGATVQDGAQTPVQEQDLETGALADARQEGENEATYEERLAAARDASAGEDGFYDSAAGEKVPQTIVLKIVGVEGAGAPPDLKRGELVYFEGVAKVVSAGVIDKLDKETFVTLEATKTVKAQMTDFRFERGHPSTELDPDQLQLGV